MDSQRDGSDQLQVRRVQYIATVTRYWDHSLALLLTLAEVSAELQYHCYLMSSAVDCLPSTDGLLGSYGFSADADCSGGGWGCPGRALLLQRSSRGWCLAR